MTCLCSICSKTFCLGLLGLWDWQHARGSHRGRVGVGNLHSHGKEQEKIMSEETELVCDGRAWRAQQSSARTGHTGVGLGETIRSGHVEPLEPGAPSLPHVDVSASMLLPCVLFSLGSPSPSPHGTGAGMRAGAGPRGGGSGGPCCACTALKGAGVTAFTVSPFSSHSCSSQTEETEKPKCSRG